MVTPDPKQAFSDRFNQLLDAVRFSPKGRGRQTELAKLFSVSQKGARKWLEGEAIPQVTRAAEIASHFGASYEWLMTGRGEMFLRPYDPSVEPVGDSAKEALFAVIPALPAAGEMIGSGTVLYIDVPGGIPVRMQVLARLHLAPESLAVMYATDDSMAPTIHDGDTLLIDTRQQSLKHGMIYALRVGEEIQVRRLLRSVTGRAWRVVSDNTDKKRYPDETVADPTKSLAIIGACVRSGIAL